jgi:hypothetical protein
MKLRALLFATTFVIALAVVPALAKSPAVLTVDPNEAGKGSRATLDLYPPDPDRDPRSLVLKVARGAKFDARATTAKCTKQQAADERCPSKSRIGGGNADVTAKIGALPPQQVDVKIDLYLAPPPRQGDKAGIVVHAKEPQSGQEGHVTGRVTPIAAGKFGLQASFANLDKAFKPPNGVQTHVDHMKLTFGKSRRIEKPNGKHVRVHLIRNPKTCDGSWDYQVVIGYSGRPAYTVNDSTPCTSAKR